MIIDKKGFEFFWALVWEKTLLDHLNAEEKESHSLTPDRGIIRGTMEHHIHQLEQENFHILVAGKS